MSFIFQKQKNSIFVLEWWIGDLIIKKIGIFIDDQNDNLSSNMFLVRVFTISFVVSLMYVMTSVLGPFSSDCGFIAAHAHYIFVIYDNWQPYPVRDL